MSVKFSVSALAIAAVSGNRRSRAVTTCRLQGRPPYCPMPPSSAEAFGENTDFPTPVVESGGSSSGLKRFCEGVGENTIDIANSSRPIREGEVAACAEAGVTDIIEVRIGYDGIVFASDVNGPEFALTPADVYNAIGAQGRAKTAHWSTTTSRTGPNSTPICLTQKSRCSSRAPSTAHAKSSKSRFCWPAVKPQAQWKQWLQAAMSADDAEDACLDVRQDGKSVDIDGDYTETLGAYRRQHKRHRRVRPRPSTRTTPTS